MKIWQRFDDNEFVKFGNHSWELAFPGGKYGLGIVQSRQGLVEVKYGEVTELWPIEVKEKNGGAFRLSGFAWETPEIDLSEPYWFELFFDPSPKKNLLGRRGCHSIRPSIPRVKPISFPLEPHLTPR